MTHKFSFLFLALLLLISISSTSSALNLKTGHQGFSIPENFSVKENGNSRFMVAASSEENLGDNPKTLTIESNFDDRQYSAESIIVFNSEVKVKNNSFSMGKHSAQIELNPGSYDVLCTFINKNRQYLYVIKENIDLTTDDININIEPEDATVQIKFRTYDPEGKLWTLPLVSKWEPDIIIEEGTARHMVIETNIFNKEVGMLTGLTTDFEFNYIENPELNEMTDIYVSPVSENYIFSQIRAQLSNDNKAYLNKFKAEGTSVTEFANNPENYKTFEEEFTFITPQQSEYYGGGYAYNLLYDDTFNSAYYATSGEIQLENGINPVGYYIDLPYDDSKVGNINLALASSISNFELNEINGQLYYKSFPIVSAPTISGDPTQYYTFPGEYYIWISAYEPQDGMNKLQVIPGLELFGYEKKQMAGKFGDNAPVLDYSYNGVTSGKYLQYTIIPKYFGQYGEECGPMLSDMNINMYYNGELQQWHTYDDLSQFPIQWWQSKKEKGKWQIELTSTPYVIDGIQGYNKTTVIYDERNEDWHAPKLRALQVRNSENTVTNKIKTGDGIMRIVATDLFFNADKKYVCQLPKQISISVAPHGSDDWQEIPITQITDQSYYNYGFSYECDITSVAPKTNSEWYDVKCEITDEAGNSQIQIVELCFNVENKTGIDTMTTIGQFADVYDLLGTKILSRAIPSQYNLPKGIYLIKWDNGKTTKISK